MSLNEQRIGTILAVLKETGATSVVDVGCGEGRLIAHLLKDKTFTRIAGMDVSMRCLEIASERLKLERMSERQRKRIELFHGSLTYRDERLAGFDAICAIEVIEHVDESRLKAFERTVFEFPGARFVIVTTPNKEYNQRFENLPAGKLRHKDHRFEWTRAEFEAWGHAVAEQHGCAVKFRPVGDIDPEVGAATQMGVFSR